MKIVEAKGYMKINKKEFEDKVGIKLQSNINAIGIDTASRTGWCKISVNTKTISFNYGFINIDSKNIYFKYNEIVNTFYELLHTPLDIVIIEDTFYRFNPNMFKMISRIGATAYTLAHLNHQKAKYLLATSARKALGIKGNCKKAEVAVYLKEVLNLNITDDDIADSIVLAINGVLE